MTGRAVVPDPPNPSPAGTSGESMQCPPTLQIKSSVTAVADEPLAPVVQLPRPREFLSGGCHKSKSRSSESNRKARPGEAALPLVIGSLVPRFVSGCVTDLALRTHAYLSAIATAARSASGMTGFSR